MLRAFVIIWLAWLLGGALPGQSAGSEPLPIEVIQQLPDTTLRLAFHFEALPDGRNFVTDPNDSLLIAHGNNEKLRADILIYYVLQELNHRFRTGMVDYAPSRDTKIRFALVETLDSGIRGASFYAHGERPVHVPGAFNVIFRYHPGPRAPNGSTGGVGSTTIYIYNALQTYLAGSQDTWSLARNIGHEIGHALSLDHTFKCDNPCAGQGFDPLEECYGDCVPHNHGSDKINCFGGSSRELMMGYGSQVYLTVCEVERMWGWLLR
ncbi:pregnancy-associated plasma protein-A [Neolewinella xylanilytica]|uniref:Pregnancy-associated plasma protein-A n=1 Tax=Neolewinella xylanilytica TaxID=1514080 RepID=A0A2S6I416_9BACT|nr:M43 family zinc metalloprotease [Neolewinella xylanilytica]PPK85801.1 pregnancy-associated plasma protein-A [Neolewinella xylanilytica]